ncbi:unnamed protein product [Prunus armeniaca]|uniref:Kelch repeat-containing protein n=1 Tax=Prunus armeniaca TaxID=36596 RepID=A0A6J5X1C9_PRUAR|nr:unnamed protein product [Prunus armeniaca]
MSRFTQHHTHSSSPAKWVFLTSCACLLGGALVADFLWASSSYSSSAYSFISSNLALDKSGTLVVPNVTANEADPGSFKDKKEHASVRLLSGTFADIAAPELTWEKMRPTPVPRLDGSSIQIKNIFTCLQDMAQLTMCTLMLIYTISLTIHGGGRLDIPKEMAHSHLGVATDGRYIYVVSGQYGPQCRGPTARIFVLDTETKKWSSMLPLPSPRYAPATQLWRGRLHVMGGSKENRHTPSVDHWSIAVKDGQALEKEWWKEAPIPRGGPHRACVVMSDRLFLIGGQEGQSSNRACIIVFSLEHNLRLYLVTIATVVYGDAYMLDGEMKWKVLPPMPKPNSHIESSLAAIMETYHTKEDVSSKGNLSSASNRNYNRTAARLYFQITFECFKSRAARLYSLNISLLELAEDGTFSRIHCFFLRVRHRKKTQPA